MTWFESEEILNTAGYREIFCGDWGVGEVIGKNFEDDEGWVMWWGHVSTDEELGCGQLCIYDGEVVDYDSYTMMSPPQGCIEALEKFGINADYLKD